MSAVLTRDEIIEPIARGSGALVHAQTFSHHAVTCSAAVAALDYIDKHDLMDRCRTIGVTFHEKLRALRELPGVGDVRGKGLLAGVEFVADTATRAPFPRSLKFAERFVRIAQDEGLIVWPNVGHADGTNGDLVMLAPPFIVTEPEIDEIVERFTARARRARCATVAMPRDRDMSKVVPMRDAIAAHVHDGDTLVHRRVHAPHLFCRGARDHPPAPTAT